MSSGSQGPGLPVPLHPTLLDDRAARDGTSCEDHCRRRASRDLPHSRTGAAAASAALAAVPRPFVDHSTTTTRTRAYGVSANHTAQPTLHEPNRKVQDRLRAAHADASSSLLAYWLAHSIQLHTAACPTRRCAQPVGSQHAFSLGSASATAPLLILVAVVHASGLRQPSIGL